MSNKIEKTIPTPSGSEKESEFIERCMGDSAMQEEFKDNDQRLAVCYDSFRTTKSVVEKAKILKARLLKKINKSGK